MEPHTDRPAGLEEFAAAMREVLRTRHDSPSAGPDALEERTTSGGYVWSWSTGVGLWRVAAGEATDPRPLLHGPGGIWRVGVDLGEHSARLTLVMLRAAGAIPPAPPADQAYRYMPCCYADPTTALYAAGGRLVCDACGTRYAPPAAAAPPPSQAELPARLAYDNQLGEHRIGPAAQVKIRPGRAAVVRGERHTAPPPAEPLRAVLYRASDPEPPVPFGYVTVRATSDEPDEHGRWEVLLPDGRAHTYDPAAPSYLVPYEDPTSEPHPLSGVRRTALLMFEPGQRPGIRTMLMTPDGGWLSWPASLERNGLPVPGASACTPPPPGWTAPDLPAHGTATAPVPNRGAA